MREKLAIVDYGCGNLFSIQRALEFVDCKEIIISSDPVEIMDSGKMIIPGVGSFPDGMTGLRKNRLDSCIQDFSQTGKPILGICLGMQLLFDVGEEFTETSGLGIISGRVSSFPTQEVGGSSLMKIPHVGWGKLSRVTPAADWEGTILAGIKELGQYVYFVHSYIAKPADTIHTLAMSSYMGMPFCSVVKKGNIFGTQFHPEKSGETGLTILKNFVDYAE